MNFLEFPDPKMMRFTVAPCYKYLACGGLYNGNPKLNHVVKHDINYRTSYK